jgi:integrase
MKFTDTFIKNLKPEPSKYYKRDANGFTIKVWPSGAKTWLYVYTFDGKRKEIKLGEYPALKLTDARIKYNDAYELHIKGSDPGALERQQQDEHRLASTVKDLVAEYLEKHAKANKKSWREDQRCLEKDVIPLWGSRKAKDIRKRDVIDLLDGIVKRGSPVMANNTFEKVRKMFNFAVEKDILEYSPCFGVKKPTKKEHKDRVLTDAELATFWNGLDKAAMTVEMRRALKLILVTAQRPGEVIGMHSEEIDGNWWTIPPKRAKNGKAHRVFLAATALELIGEKQGYIGEKQGYIGEKQGYIFESPRLLEVEGREGIPKPMDVNAVAYAVRRNVEEPKKDAGGKETEENKPAGDEAPRQKLIMEAWTPHDLRRTAATNMSALGHSDEVIDAVLNHVKKGVIAIYNRHRYDREKQTALESWERKLKSIVTGKSVAKVVSMHTRPKSVRTA